MAGEAGYIQLHRLRETREIHHHNDGLLLEATKKCENLRVIGMEKFKRAARKRLKIFPHRNDPAHPPEQRREIFLLILNVDCFVVIFWINGNRQIELLWIRS